VSGKRKLPKAPGSFKQWPRALIHGCDPGLRTDFGDGRPELNAETREAESARGSVSSPVCRGWLPPGTESGEAWNRFLRMTSYPTPPSCPVAAQREKPDEEMARDLMSVWFSMPTTPSMPPPSPAGRWLHAGPYVCGRRCGWEPLRKPAWRRQRPGYEDAPGTRGGERYCRMGEEAAGPGSKDHGHGPRGVSKRTIPGRSFCGRSPFVGQKTRPGKVARLSTQLEKAGDRGV